MYVWNENFIYPIIQILITILFNPSDHPYYTYDHPTNSEDNQFDNPEDNLIILTSILTFFANIWMILRIVPTILKHLLTKSILRVTLPNLAMISLTSRTAKVQPTEWLSDCSQVLERLSPLKQDRIKQG